MDIAMDTNRIIAQQPARPRIMPMAEPMQSVSEASLWHPKAFTAAAVSLYPR